ncbi:MAG TPA: hypothetical protein DIS66_03510, partial [Candidatus Omnitrophica bacterium]|nr:hypothetical protein [Candidatus Omnitrophota bacterium]
MTDEKLSETYRHFNSLIWQVPSIGIAVATAVLYAAHELGLRTNQASNWVIDTRWMQFFVLEFGAGILFIMSLVLYRYRHFQTWAGPESVDSPPIGIWPKANRWLQFLICQITGVLLGLGAGQLFRLNYLLLVGVIFGFAFFIILEVRSKTIEEKIINKTVNSDSSAKAPLKGVFIFSKFFFVTLVTFA